MIADIDLVCQRLSDRPDALMSVRHNSQTPGSRGRPQIEFDPQFLSFALDVRGPAGIAPILGCSPRTVRRRALDYQLLERGQAPFLPVPQEDGTVARIRHGSTKHTRLTDISDADLDRVMETILRDFPDFGRRLIDGRLRAQGLRVSKARLTDSYRRVHGPPLFTRQPIQRRQYWVAGVNSLWHHDGQHGESL
jgi:hypothetical protein